MTLLVLAVLVPYNIGAFGTQTLHWADARTEIRRVAMLALVLGVADEEALRQIHWAPDDAAFRDTVRRARERRLYVFRQPWVRLVEAIDAVDAEAVTHETCSMEVEQRVEISEGTYRLAGKGRTADIDAASSVVVLTDSDGDVVGRGVIARPHLWGGAAAPFRWNAYLHSGTMEVRAYLHDGAHLCAAGTLDK